MTKPLPSHIHNSATRSRTDRVSRVRVWRRTLLATAMTAAIGIAAGTAAPVEAQQAYYRGQAQLGESVVVDYSVLEQLGQPQTYPDLVRPGQTTRGTALNVQSPPAYPPTSTTLPLANARSGNQSGLPLPPPSEAPKSRVLLPGASNSAQPQPAQPQTAQPQTAQPQTVATRPAPAPAETGLADEIKSAEKPEPRADGGDAAAKPKPAAPPEPATAEIAKAEPQAAPELAAKPTPKPAAPDPQDAPEPKDALEAKETPEPSAAPTQSVESAAIPKPAAPPAPALEAIEAEESGSDAANSQAVKDVKKEYETLLAEAGTNDSGTNDSGTDDAAEAIEPPGEVDTPNAAPEKAEAPQPAAPQSTEIAKAADTAETEVTTAGTGDSGQTATQTAAIDPDTFIAKADGLSVLFEGDGTDLPEGVKGQLDKLAADIKQQDDTRIKLMGYSEQIGDLASQPRRVSLFRTLSVRSYLMNKGISSRQINVQALGANLPDDGPKNRVDIEIQN